MKKYLPYGVLLAILGLAATPLFSQTQTTSSSNSSSYIQTSKIVGTKVKTQSGEEVGVVKDVVLDRSNGCMAYTVLSTGGTGSRVTGQSKLVAVPWSVYTVSPDMTYLTTTVERDRIYNGPVFEYSRIGDASYTNTVYSSFGVSAGVGVSSATTTAGSTTTTGATNQTQTSAYASPGATVAAVASATPGVSASPNASATASATAAPSVTASASASPSASSKSTRGAKGGTTPASSPRHKGDEMTGTSGESSSEATGSSGTKGSKSSKQSSNTEKSTSSESSAETTESPSSKKSSHKKSGRSTEGTENTPSPNEQE